MNRLETIERITGLENLNEVVSIKPHHTGYNVSMIVASDDNVYDLTFAYASCNFNSDLKISINYLQDKDITAEDVKDAFRTNKVDMQYSFVVVSQTVDYEINLDAWNMQLDDLIGHVNADRACVSDYYTIDDVKLTHNDKVIVVDYSSKFSSEIEEVTYVNYSPIVHDNKIDAKKAVIARQLFGKDNAYDVVFDKSFAEIITPKEYEKLSEIGKVGFTKYGMGIDDFYVSIVTIDSPITSDNVLRVVKDVVDNDELFSQYYIAKFGVNQGNLSKLRQGDRQVDSIRLRTALNMIDAYNSKQ